jgi:hypothetical protein
VDEDVDELPLEEEESELVDSMSLSEEACWAGRTAGLDVALAPVVDDSDDAEETCIEQEEESVESEEYEQLDTESDEFEEVDVSREEAEQEESSSEK